MALSYRTTTIAPFQLVPERFNLSVFLGRKLPSQTKSRNP